METSLMNFDLSKETNSSIIKVIGVGGGGCNAVDHMFRQGIKGVDFIVCNTDQQALDKSPVPTKITLGATLTEGLGAGSNPEVGKNSAIESLDEIKALLGRKTKMIFITAGMGGGTGTGAAPVIAGVAKEMGILTVAIVTIPFGFEGKRRKTQAEEGIEELKKNVDTLLIICNNKLREIYGDLKMTESFGHADNILTIGAKGIAEIITEKLHVNTDFADIQTVLKDSGKAIMGSAQADGENRALKAIEKALNSPLLDDSEIKGARHVLLNIKCGSGANEISMDEFGEITDYLQDAAGGTAEVIQGWGIDETLENTVVVTIIATGFNNKSDKANVLSNGPTKKVTDLYENSLNTSNLLITKEQPNDEKSSEKNIHNLYEATPKADEKIPQPILEALNTEELKEEPVNEIILDIQSSRNKIDEKPAIEFNNKEEMRRKAFERAEKLKEYDWKAKRNFSEMEKVPAYQRKNVQLENTPHSSDSQVSRLTLSEGEDKKTEIRSNNSFLHDNVD